jgi:molybdenum cofactor synthesis domain-containing protein
MLSALVESAGGEPLNFQSVSDDLGDIKDTIRSAVAGSDIVVATGGVSVGKYDLTKAALAGLGAEIYFEKLMLKPGKPTVFARIDDTIIFGLPGNPVSAAVTFYLFVRKALLLMQSANRSDLRRARAIAGGPLKAARERDTYLPGKLEVDADGRLIVTPLKWLGSSDFIGFAAADALAHVPAGSVVRPGETADILFL